MYHLHSTGCKVTFSLKRPRWNTGAVLSQQLDIPYFTLKRPTRTETASAMHRSCPNPLGESVSSLFSVWSQNLWMGLWVFAKTIPIVLQRYKPIDNIPHEISPPRDLESPQHRALHWFHRCPTAPPFALVVKGPQQDSYDTSRNSFELVLICLSFDSRALTSGCEMTLSFPDMIVKTQELRNRLLNVMVRSSPWPIWAGLRAVTPRHVTIEKFA